MNRSLWIVSLWAISTLSTAAWAQEKKDDKSKKDDLVPNKLTSEADNRRNRGWVPVLRLSASLAFSHSDNVVGAQDGQTWNIGPGIDAELSYFRDPHEWRNTLVVRHVQTRTPVVDQFVKTLDTLRTQTIYLFHIPGFSWLGPYVHGELETSLFPGEDVRAVDTNYVIQEVNGAKETQTAKRLALTDAFAPLMLKQAVGVFAKPVDIQHLVLELRFGAGAREVFVQHGLVLKDDKNTAEIEVLRLQDYTQLGGEVFAGISGTFLLNENGLNRPITYSLTAEVMVPFYSTRTENRGSIELANVRLEARLGVKLFSWASLDYLVRVIREPLTVDEVQVQNNLLLNLGYVFFE